jgi:hypothetical protein
VEISLHKKIKKLDWIHLNIVYIQINQQTWKKVEIIDDEKVTTIFLFKDLSRKGIKKVQMYIQSCGSLQFQNNNLRKIFVIQKKEDITQNSNQSCGKYSNFVHSLLQRKESFDHMNTSRE